MGKPQHKGHGHEAAPVLEPQNAAQTLEASLDWLDEEHVTLIEEAPASSPRPARFDDTQRIWCPQVSGTGSGPELG